MFETSAEVIYPVLLLHVILLSLNVVRTLDMTRLKRRAPAF